MPYCALGLTQARTASETAAHEQGRWIMKSVAPIVLAMALAGCQTTAMHDVYSPGYSIPPDSQLILKREIAIPAGQRHVKLQHGRVVPGVDEYKVNCELRVYHLGADPIRPDRFSITRSGTGREWHSQPYVMRFYRVLSLRSEAQPDVLKLICQRWDDPLAGRNVSIPEMQQALGDYVGFDFPNTPSQ